MPVCLKAPLQKKRSIMGEGSLSKPYATHEHSHRGAIEGQHVVDLIIQ